MGKIKLNLVSGAVVEKPLINAFKANNNTYVVLDNEINGSMGLPIILVCKYENNKLTKILDQNEWSIVKEYLKNIIAGNQIEFINIGNELVADDIYYTQLTLPIPSFEALKNSYKIEENIDVENILGINPEPVVNSVSPVAPVSVDPVVAPTVDPVASPVVEGNIPTMETPQVSEIPVQEPANISVANDIVSPTLDIPQVEPVVEPVSPIDFAPPISPIVEQPAVVVEPSVTPAVEPVSPVVEPVIQNVVEPVVENAHDVNIFKEQKEAFMQACENMFDALVQKFERELENRK